MSALWLTILAIGLVTYATRVVPLVWRVDRVLGGPESCWLDRLVPCLLAGMAATQILPVLRATGGSPALLPGLLGLAAVAVAIRLRPNPGFATLAGMAAYFLAS